MIYLTTKYCDFSEASHVNSVFEVDFDNVEELYLNFLAEKAKEMEVVHNPHCGNMMNRENNHPHLTEQEYKQKVKEWNKFLNENNIEKFILEHLAGVELEYKQITKF